MFHFKIKKSLQSWSVLVPLIQYQKLVLPTKVRFLRVLSLLETSYYLNRFQDDVLALFVHCMREHKICVSFLEMIAHGIKIRLHLHNGVVSFLSSFSSYSINVEVWSKWSLFCLTDPFHRLIEFVTFYFCESSAWGEMHVAYSMGKEYMIGKQVTKLLRVYNIS